MKVQNSLNNKGNKKHSNEQNEYYSLSEQKSKLLATVTLNEFSLDNSFGKGILNEEIRELPHDLEEDTKKASIHFEDGLELKANFIQIAKQQEHKAAMINNSEFDPESFDRGDLSPGRELRAGSFKSLQNWGDDDSESNFGSRSNSNFYLNYPREKIPKEESKIDKLYHKNSWITDLNKSEIITDNMNKNYFAPNNEVESGEKQIAEYFENRIPVTRVTSLEIGNSQTSNPNQPVNFDASHNEENNENSSTTDQKEREEIVEMRMKFLKQKKKERESKTKEDTLYKYSRDDMIEKVSKIILEHIIYSEENIKHQSQGAMLFDERIYKRDRWKVHTTHGFSGIQPIFLYCLEKVEYDVKEWTHEEIIEFIKRIFVDMQLAIECILIMLIYIERLMVIGGVEIRYMNWKPISFIGILLASKFWEDLNFWNVDFLGVGQSYTLEGINQLESQFLALSKYNLFVSASLYARYYFAVREKFANKEVHNFLIIFIAIQRKAKIIKNW